MCTKNFFPMERDYASLSIGSSDLAAHRQVEIIFSTNLTYVTSFLYLLNTSKNLCETFC